MHKFLRAVGFSQYEKKKDIYNLLDLLEENRTYIKSFKVDNDTNICEIRSETAPGMGICLIGELDAERKFEREFYFPYHESGMTSTFSECFIQRHAEKETFAGMIEEMSLGISLIFYVQNLLDYRERYLKEGEYLNIRSVNFSAISVSGEILLPVKRTQRQLIMSKIASRARTMLLEAARNGDEDAMESLTIDEMDTYTKISRRVMNEDLYSIVESTFMPYGFECDQYSIIGEIKRVEKVSNIYTNEEIYRMVIECNDLYFMVCINSKDLIGEPAAGRRFKGQIWMQGILNFE